MNKLNPSSIFNKLLSKLQQDPDWKVIANNSVTTALLKSNAEVMAETARYGEYLFKESRWDTAQNISSALSMSNMLGYQPKRKISARGKIYVSTDPRTHLVGTDSISIDSFKGLKPENASSFEPAWSIPYEDIAITPTCSIVDDRGVSYIATNTIFSKDSCWAEVSIMQGSRKSTFVDIDTIRNTVTSSKIDPYLYIPVKISDCEDASNSTSKAFFKVFVARSENKNNKEDINYTEYRVVDSLLFSSTSDMDVEVYNDFYSQELFYLKFNNDSSRGLTLDISQNSDIVGIRVDYVETLGKESNVSELYRPFTISDVHYTKNKTTSTVKLYGINFSALTGGADEETIYEIKQNAPKFYVTNYTAGTKEAYEKTISNMEFSIEGLDRTIRPKKVKVYGGTEVSNNTIQPITCITFSADGLEDLASYVKGDSNIYSEVENALNIYLAKLKSPQDTLRFVAPDYISFAVGVNCLVSRNKVDGETNNPIELASYITNDIEKQWGPDSNLLDFGRAFQPSRDIENLIHDNYKVITSIETEVEAIKKLNWNEATRMNPSNEDDPASTVIHTVRLPFDFNNVFLGGKNKKGFKDYKVGSSYVMRLDFMYKKPTNLDTPVQYHTSIFVEETRNTSESNTDAVKEAFFLKKNTNNSQIIWPDYIESLPNYNVLNKNNSSELTKSWQFRYRDQVYDDISFSNLIEDSQRAYIPTVSSSETDPGVIDDYLIYYSANYKEDIEDRTIGQGWIELTFDSIYNMLVLFSTFNATLRDRLRSCPLSVLKCGNNATSVEAFSSFINIVKEYVDIYVSMRPIDPRLQINTVDERNGNSILYIDSVDNYSPEMSIRNLTADKRPRMISVACEYEKG